MKIHVQSLHKNRLFAGWVGNRSDIEKCSRVYILAVIDNRISHMGQFELKSFFAGGGAFFHGNEKWLK